MNTTSNRRNDISQTFEDFERVMEDYFAIIPPELHQFDLNKIIRWEYDDINNSMTFYFENEWLLDEYVDMLEQSPSVNRIFEYNDYEHIDRKNLSLTIIGKDGGLM